MPLAHVALAAGFGSVRRFNALFQKLYGPPPSQFRRADETAGSALVLMLPFAPPYDFDAMLAALAARRDPNEQVANGTWRRAISLNGTDGTADVAMGEAPQGALHRADRRADADGRRAETPWHDVNGRGHRTIRPEGAS